MSFVWNSQGALHLDYHTVARARKETHDPRGNQKLRTLAELQSQINERVQWEQHWVSLGGSYQNGGGKAED